MGRHALLYRSQHQARHIQRMVKRQPLVARVTGQNRLLQAVNPSAEMAPWTHSHLEANHTAQRFNLVPARRAVLPTSYILQTVSDDHGLSESEILAEQQVSTAETTPNQQTVHTTRDEPQSLDEASIVTVSQQATHIVQATEKVRPAATHKEPTSIPHQPVKQPQKSSDDKDQGTSILTEKPSEAGVGASPRVRPEDSHQDTPHVPLIDGESEQYEVAVTETKDAHVPEPARLAPPLEQGEAVRSLDQHDNPPQLLPDSAVHEQTVQVPEMLVPVEEMHPQELEHPQDLAQPAKNIAMRHNRSRIEEQPEQSTISPQPIRDVQRSSQEKSTTTPKAAADRTPAEGDDLFIPNGTDRSLQTWLARLQGEQSPDTTRDNTHEPANRALAATHNIPTQTQQHTNTEGLITAASIAQKVASMNARRINRAELRSNKKIEELTRAISPEQRREKQAQHILSPESTADSEATPQGSLSFRGETLGNGVGASPRVRPGAVARTRPYPTSPEWTENPPQSLPTPLAERTRRILQPLVGIDPASVRVHRDVPAQHLADAYHADAITLGNDIALATGHTDDTPETLGLLAHELTHVAQQRTARFVPPLARTPSTTSPSKNPSSVANERAGETLYVPAVSTAQQQSIPSDEEALALRVEGRTAQLAEQATPTAADPTVNHSQLANGSAHTRPQPVATRETWGSLPAPWEPLPAWLTTAPAQTQTNAPTSVIAPQPPQATPVSREVAHSAPGPANIGPGPDESGVKRAGVERSLQQEKSSLNTALAQHPEPAMTQTPEADLDMLARQVYDRLKRRLGVESRRGS